MIDHFRGDRKLTAVGVEYVQPSARREQHLGNVMSAIYANVCDVTRTGLRCLAEVA